MPSLLRFSLFLLFATSACPTLLAQQADSLAKGRLRGDVRLPAVLDSLAKQRAKTTVLPDSLPPRADSLGLARADSMLAKQGKKQILRGFFKNDYPNPKKALLFSFLLPGAGQAYNKAWWKLPIVYGALGGMLWQEKINIDEYRKYKTAYYNRANDLPVEPELDFLDKQSLKYRRDVMRKRLESSSLFLGLTYVLVAAEAFVDAHLNTFDVSDDLSLQIKPGVLSTPNWGSSVGLGLAVSF